MSGSGIITKPLGNNGPLVPRLGLGLMVNSGVYGVPPPEDERMAFLDGAFAKEETFWDTADEYNDSEDLIGRWFAANPSKREHVFLATKFAVRSVPKHGEGFGGLKIDSSPEYAKQAIEKSLSRLQTSYVDLYYIHRLDKITPIEKTIEGMVELKNQGKIRHIGMSECSAASLRRAHAVHPITAVQIEYSPFVLEIEDPKIRLLQTARELGIAVVAYSPLGNGILGGEIRSKEDVMKPKDLRGSLPWLNEQNIAQNIAVVDQITEIARSKGISSAQLSLAWILAQGDDVFAIPGTKKLHRLQENLDSMKVTLTPPEEDAVRELSKKVVGGRVQNLTGYQFADTPTC